MSKIKKFAELNTLYVLLSKGMGDMYKTGLWMSYRIKEVYPNTFIKVHYMRNGALLEIKNLTEKEFNDNISKYSGKFKSTLISYEIAKNFIES